MRDERAPRNLVALAQHPGIPANRGDVAALCTAIEWQRHQPAWQREAGRYVPLPAKWLEDQRWNDEPSEVPHVTDGTLKAARAVAQFAGPRKS